MSIAYQLPAGPKNLAPLFPSVDWNLVGEYYLEVKAGGTTILTTNRYTRDCCCCGDTLRLFFVNYLGGIDGIQLQLLTTETEIKSTRWKKPLSWPLCKPDGGWQRSNISGLVTLVAETTTYAEKHNDWLEQLKATPNAWIQWEGTQGQADNYLPVIVEDGKHAKRKDGERYNNVFQVQFTMSNELFILRN